MVGEIKEKFSGLSMTIVRISKMKPRILITGSSGMLGTDLIDELKRGYELIEMDLVRSPKSIVRRFYKADITDRRSITVLFGKIRPDVVIHTAAWTDVDGCELDQEKAYRINADGTKNVAFACKASGATLIYISTDFIFDGRKKRPYKESDKPNPLGVYADSKLKGEVAVKKALKRYFIIRTSWLYGKAGKNFVNTILAKAKRDRILKVVDDQVGSPTHTKDLAKAIRVLIDKKINDFGIYHVSNLGSVSWYEYAKTIVGMAGIKAKVLPISSKELARPARRPAMSALDNSKFKRFTDYSMRRWEKALEEYLS